MIERVGTPGLCLVALLLIAAVPAWADNNDDLQVLRTRIESLQRDLSKAESTRSDAADALRASEKAISEVNRGIHELDRRKRSLNAGLSGIEKQVRATAAAAARQQQLLERLVRNQYMHAGSDGLRLILEGGDPAAIERRMRYYGYISRLRVEMLRDMRKGLATLAGLREQALAKRAEIAANEAEQKRARKHLEDEKLARRKILVRVASVISKDRREIGRLKRDEDRLAKLVEQLGKVIAAAPPARRPGHTVDEVADTSFIGKAFATLKGKLKLPVRGELYNRFGGQREEGGTTWKGLFIRAGGGQQVRAVADGRVVYADWLRGFGNLLIIDHGSGFMSLYGNTESILKQVGEAALSGETVASVGDSGGAGESGLYFELRHEGKPFDPMKWVAR